MKRSDVTMKVIVVTIVEVIVVVTITIGIMVGLMSLVSVIGPRRVEKVVLIMVEMVLAVWMGVSISRKVVKQVSDFIETRL